MIWAEVMVPSALVMVIIKNPQNNNNIGSIGDTESTERGSSVMTICNSSHFGKALIVP